MECIWAPWRMEYIAGPKAKGCILCDKPEETEDKRNYILYRGERTFVMLNSFPYNPGHLMISPYRHVASIEDLVDDELIEHFALVRKCTQVLRKTFKPAGFNVGINIGKSAGAGVEGHIHTHIVPRWEGDANFMPVIADTKVVPEALSATYDKLKGKI